MGMTGRELRERFLEFFVNIEGFEHTRVPSAPLVPPDDPTLLFTSAGMVQFKRFYSGEIEPLPYTRATTCQKCLRAGGKGSDLENVGKTLRHHTFFEMLGNFSFGDYFKREAIRFAWQFVTEEMSLPKERLFPTVFQEDQEAAKIWKEETDAMYTPVGLDEKENFWGPAGDTGACGPCSELCFFMGSERELNSIQEALQRSEDDYMPVLARRITEEGDMFLEIWNMVFPQFDQQRDGSRPQLKYRGIDTGAGLERMTTAMMYLEGRASSPYETDLMWPIVKAASEILGVEYHRNWEEESGTENERRNRLAVNAISDHARAMVFCLAEGLTPGNIGRRYVVRRIQRRALRFSSLLGMDRPFMHELYDPVVEVLGEHYPEIKKNPEFIRTALRREEETFLRTIDRGTKILSDLVDEARDRGDKVIPGSDAFKLWDTYGFPIDLTKEIAEEENVKVDLKGFHSSMEEQREEARRSWKGARLEKEADLLEPLYDQHGTTDFVGYDTTGPVKSTLMAIVYEGELVDKVEGPGKAILVLRETPFYAEAGGQIGDQGVLSHAGGEFFVRDTQKTPYGLVLHIGELKTGWLKVGEEIEAEVNSARRRHTIRNHSSVHLLQNTLKRMLGEHVTQAGSFVGPDYSRFDFTHPEALSREQLKEIQAEVNRLIMENHPVETEVLSLEEAKAKGAIAPFGEKYGPVVRVVKMGPSIEFCGGTHSPATAFLGHYRIVGESSISAGVRRIEAVTGERANQMELEEEYDVVAPLQTLTSAKGTEVVDRVDGMLKQVKELQKELNRLKEQAALAELDRVLENSYEMDQARMVVVRMDDLDSGQLRTVTTTLRDRLGDTGVAVVLSAQGGEKVAIVAAIGEKAQQRFPANKVVNALAEPLGGRGGGKPDMAQAGAKDVAKLDDVVARAPEILKQMQL